MVTQWLDHNCDGLENEVNSVDILLLHFSLDSESLMDSSHSMLGDTPACEDKFAAHTRPRCLSAIILLSDRAFTK